MEKIVTSDLAPDNFGKTISKALRYCKTLGLDAVEYELKREDEVKELGFTIEPNKIFVWNKGFENVDLKIDGVDREIRLSLLNGSYKLYDGVYNSTDAVSLQDIVVCGSGYVLYSEFYDSNERYHRNKLEIWKPDERGTLLLTKHRYTTETMYTVIHNIGGTEEDREESGDTLILRTKDKDFVGAALGVFGGVSIIENTRHRLLRLLDCRQYEGHIEDIIGTGMIRRQPNGANNVVLIAMDDGSLWGVPSKVKTLDVKMNFGGIKDKLVKVW